MLPKKLDMIPAEPGNHASIFGWRLDGVEHVGIAWSDRSDAAAPPACPSTATADTKWWVSQTNDFGDSWTCFKGGYGACVANNQTPGSNGAKTAIARDTSWKTCVGPNQSSRQSRNNDRPEVAVHAPAVASGNGFEEEELEKRWRFAVTQRASGSGSNMRVCVYGHDAFLIAGAWDRIEQQFCSSNTNPDGQAVQDAWGQSMVFMHSDQDAHLFTALLRESAQTTGNPIKMIAMQKSATGAKTEANVSSQSFGYETDWGLGTGVSIYQKCDLAISGCPTGSAFTYPSVGVLAVWPDTRVSTTTRADIFTRSFLW
jgi:hypothetical protein